MKKFFSYKYTPKIIICLLLVVYTIVYTILYKYWLNAYFGYFGFKYISLSFELTLYVGTLILIPAIIAPVHIKKGSLFLFWIMYIVVYVPSVITPFFIQLQPVFEVMKLGVFLCFGNVIISLVYYAPLLKINLKSLKKNSFMQILIGLSGILLLYVLYIYRGNLRFVTFSKVYDVRFAGGEIAKGTFAGYAVMMLSGALLPLVIAIGLIYKKYFLLLFGILGMVILYATSAMKATILLILIMFVFYFIVSEKSNRYLIHKLLGGLIFICILLLLVWGTTVDSTLGMVTSILFLRTLGIPGLLTAQYHDFFLTHPLTYMSHVNGIDLLIQYPYNQPLGIIIGNHYFGINSVNSNANFWITDGMAAFGLWGIPLISLILALIFWLIDSISSKLNIKLIILWLTFTAINLGNTSVFTTLLSGGLGLICFLMIIMPNRHYKKIEFDKVISAS